MVYRTKKKERLACHGEHHHFHGNCESCEGGIVKSAIIHSVKIFMFLFVINVILGYAAEVFAPFMEYITDKPLLQSVIACTFGIIPNCSASVVLTELYLAGKISMSSLIGGLCSGAGVGLLVLIKMNKNLKQDLVITALIYILGIIVGCGLSLIL